MDEVTPYLRNRRTGIVVRYNPITATHPDMVLCDEMPGEQKAAKPARKPRKRAVKTELESKPSDTAEIDDLLTGIDHG